VLLRLDHLVIATPDPDAAAGRLERDTGLVCRGGGRHVAWGTFNRLAWLGDTFLELIGVFDPALTGNAAVSRAVQAALETGRPGLVTYAIATDDATADVARLRAAGSSIGDVETRSRTRPDGEVVTWHSATAELGPALPPFIIEHEPGDAEWNEEVRAARAADPHRLGGRARVAGITLPVPDVSLATAAYAATLGLATDGMPTVHVGDQEVRLVAGRPPADPAIIDLEVVGPAGTRPEVDTLGVRFRFRNPA
jgi:hypothetical protein